MRYLKNFVISNQLFIIICLSLLLRLPFLDRFPPALYSDEVSQGYNAYSILKTGRDEYGTFLPVALRSFGDWKPPLQTYLMIPTIDLFGLNAWGVRLPSALVGVATVWIMYYLTLEIITFFCREKIDLLSRKKQQISLIAALLLAISPWHILFSRAAFEANISIFFLTSGLLVFFRGQRYPKWFIIGAVLFVLSIYSYHSTRLVIPILSIYLICFGLGKFKAKIKYILVGILLGCLLLVPLGLAAIKTPELLFSRSKYVSIFYDQRVAIELWNLTTSEGHLNPKLVQFFHNKPYLYGREIMQRFLQHVNPYYLTIVGDKHTPFQIPNMGLFYLTDLLFVLVGLKMLGQKNINFLLFLLGWLIISVLPAALTFLTPAANRSFAMLIPLIIIITIGLAFFVDIFKQPFVKSVIIGFYLVQFLYFSYQFSVILPRDFAYTWHYGNKELMQYLKTQENNFQTVYISEHVAQPYIFLLFYQQIDPYLAQKEVKRNFISDPVGFEHAQSFGKYVFFVDNFDLKTVGPDSLLVLTSIDTFQPIGQKIYQISYPNGKVANTVYTID